MISRLLTSCLVVSLFISKSTYSKTILIGTGSGTISQMGMGTLKRGDVLAIRAGSYRQGTFAHLNGITIVNAGGVVEFTGTVYFGFNEGVTFWGKGSPKLKYGFRFTGVNNNEGCFELDGYNISCVWQRIEFMNCAADAFGNQSAITTYNGTEATTKRLLRCRVARIHMDGCGSFLTNFRGAFNNVVDSCDFGYVLVDRPNSTMLINASAFYRTDIHHWTIGQQICSGENDVGCFQITGSPNIYCCSELGANWGWFARILQQSLNQADDCHIYNNIRIGNRNYGFVDYRQQTDDYYKEELPFLRGGNMYVVNNTCGNLITTNNYVTAIVAAYDFPGQHLYVLNNFRFHSVNQNQVANEVNVVHYGSVRDTITESNNLYVEDPLKMGVVGDTVHCEPLRGSPLIDGGVPVFFEPTDFRGVARPQGSRFDIGALEYFDARKPPILLRLKRPHVSLAK